MIKMNNFVFAFLVPAALVMSAMTAGFADEGSQIQPAIRLTAHRSDTTIRVLSTKEASIVEIGSGFGIDRATLERAGDAWPNAIVLRLNLKGLESLRLSNENVTVDCSASAMVGAKSRASLREGTREKELTPSDDYWTDVKFLERPGNEKGFFEVAIPRKLIENNPKRIGIHWIDFYRT